MKVGDYVRYKYENCIYIGEIKFISEVMGYEETLQLDIDDCMEEILKENIIKSSSNIIDLIEVGDYVNGYRVESVDTEYEPYGVYIEIPFVDSESIGCNMDLIRTEEIESIVTKEQFESMEYKIGE